ncbi:MAG: DUF1269 domain-containing protein [Chloroflexales bacterium]|nr:DUF1269 domain-containing protein [Chloroflexales bacterium]
MTAENTLELVVSAFKSPAGAGLALAALVDAKSEVLQGIKELATVRRGNDAQLHIQESNDMSPGSTAYGGGTVGLLIGILGGPLGMLIGGATGALIGGLGGKLIDTGIPDARLREIGALLAPNTSAIVAFVAPERAQPLMDALAQGGGTALAQPVAADMPERLAAMRAGAEQSTTGASPTASPVINPPTSSTTDTNA